MRRIAIAAAKGGTGKTTTAVTLAHGMALAGARVLLVDCDPRRDAASHFGLAARSGVGTWLAGESAAVDPVRRDLSVLQSGGERLAALEPDLAPATQALRLRRALDGLRDFDVVIVDCPAGWGSLTRLGVAACDEVIVPLAADYLSLAGAAATLRGIAALPGAARRLLGILPTFLDRSLASAAQVESVLAELLAGRVLQTRIHVADALRDAPARRGTIFDTAPLSEAARDYAELVEEVRALVVPNVRLRRPAGTGVDAERAAS
jgi:chromosome partitioning protein